jgi:hypothetical protein
MPVSDYDAALRTALETLQHFLSQVRAQEARARDHGGTASKGYDPITLHGPEVGAVSILAHIATKQQEELRELSVAVDASVAGMDPQGE